MEKFCSGLCSSFEMGEHIIHNNNSPAVIFLSERKEILMVDAVFSGFNPSALFTPAFCSQSSVCVTLARVRGQQRCHPNTTVCHILTSSLTQTHTHGSSRCSPTVDLDVGYDEVFGLTSLLIGFFLLFFHLSRMATLRFKVLFYCS